ncbi:branched-chain amino acid ABC transporter, periplasmic branched-chain amino acid-binding protein (plasmid) [Aminobacter sp. Y103A]|uniref:ABC transporter substrate-binding protein n=1 Tax=Aminobacter sp. Y103A TaxID=1870862 RepID=UPI002572EF38|nr:ABC transporter substrate-binding protein [Aminobacter sp. SS-2016]BBD41498.1 branched-chain amino acid ABC transporter, periplasmic branched-chain amino acid-binding protein [Aminobacter sp. SS-2016]
MTDKVDTRSSSSRREFLKTIGAGGAATAAAVASLGGTAQAQAADPVIIGAPLQMTGGGAADGIEFKRGLELAAEEINAIGGILGREVKIVVADTESGGDDKITSAGQRLIDNDGANALIAGYNFGSQVALQNVAADASIIYMHADTARAHTELVKADPDKYWGSFMYSPSELYYGYAFLEFIKSLEQRGEYVPANKKIALITGPLVYSINIANSIKEKAGEHGYEISLFETVQAPTTEWGPTLAKIREDQPAFIAVTHFFPADQAQFMIQFLTNPTNSLVYLQYGASLAAFRDIAGDASVGALYATNIGVLSGEVSKDFTEKYLAKYGEKASPNGGAQTYEALHLFAQAAAIAGGVGKAYEDEQNRKIAARLKASIYRGPTGIIRFDQEAQQAISYPVQTKDPSLGMAHIFSQIKDKAKNGAIISPFPYEEAKFELPKWIKS